MGMVQEVRIARRTGFCYGVREAIDKAKESASAGKHTHTLGQVVHNEGVIHNLLQFGVESVDTLDDVDDGAAVVIRAHGVKPEVFARAESRGLEVIDGPCTWVIQEQRPLQDLVAEGYTNREIARLLGSPLEPRHAPPRAGDVRDSLADVGKARAALGYEPRFPVREGLARAIGWYREHLSGARA